jgi:hypothetical protein
MSWAGSDEAWVTEEGRRQQRLLDSLWQTGDASLAAPVQGLKADASSLQRGEQAYRINAKALSERALTAVYPRSRERLGSDDFAALAWTLWRKHPPTRGDLACWGQVLPEFLASQTGMDARLVELARLEWALHEAERALDAPLDTDSLQLLANHEPEQLRLHFMPGLCVLALHGDTIGMDSGAALSVLVWREGWRGSFAPLGTGSAALMAASITAQSLEQALQSALAVEPGFDFSAWLIEALQRGWLLRVEAR